MDKRTVYLSTAQARQTAHRYVDEAPADWVMVLKPKTRSLDQNARLHMLLQNVAKSVPWAGKRRDTETWKRLFTAAWMRARGEATEFMPSVDDHGVDVVFRHTSQLSIKECGELMEFIEAWCAEHGHD